MLSKIKIRIVIGLMLVTAAIIVGLAIYLFANFSAISISNGLILAGIGVFALLIVLVMLIILVKGINTGTKK